MLGLNEAPFLWEDGVDVEAERLDTTSLRPSFVNGQSDWSKRPSLQAAGEHHGVVTRVAIQLGNGQRDLCHWVKQAGIDSGLRPGITTKERQRIGKLESEVRGAATAERDPLGGCQLLRAGTRPETAQVLHFINEQRDRWGSRADLQNSEGRPIHPLRGGQPAVLCPTGRRSGPPFRARSASGLRTWSNAASSPQRPSARGGRGFADPLVAVNPRMSSEKRTMTGEEWIAKFAAAAGVTPPPAAELNTLLGLAGVAAHASERTAAPITTWLAAKAGLSPGAALELALSIRPSADQGPAG